MPSLKPALDCLNDKSIFRAVSERFQGGFRAVAEQSRNELAGQAQSRSIHSHSVWSIHLFVDGTGWKLVPGRRSETKERRSEGTAHLFKWSRSWHNRAFVHTPFSYEQLYRITDKTSTTWFKLCKYIVHDDGVGWRAGGQAGGRRGGHMTHV